MIQHCFLPISSTSLYLCLLRGDIWYFVMNINFLIYKITVLYVAVCLCLKIRNASDITNWIFYIYTYVFCLFNVYFEILLRNANFFMMDIKIFHKSMKWLLFIANNRALFSNVILYLKLLYRISTIVRVWYWTVYIYVPFQLLNDIYYVYTIIRLFYLSLWIYFCN